MTAREAPDFQSGGKREQPSSTIQQDNKVQTQIRNRKIQRAAEALWRDDPNLKKKLVAVRLAKTNDFHDVSFLTIKRRIGKAKYI
jgi:hypothetical protein